MAKFRIIGKGSAFSDNWGINSNNVGAVRINGRCVERCGKDGKWITGYNGEKNIKELLWEENGNIIAVNSDGSVSSTNINLTCNPTKKPQPWNYETTDGNTPQPNQKKQNKEEKKSIFDSGWWWKWPLKALWALIKFIFVTVLFTSLSNSEKR